jgi:hypothetical protein
MRWIDAGLHILLFLVAVVVLLRTEECGSRPNAELSRHQGSASQRKMDLSRSRVTYKGFRTGDSWEVAVARPGQPVRLLDRPRRPQEWALSILRDYLRNPARAEDLYQDFASVTINRFTKDWELSGPEIDNVIIEVEMLRARWRMLLARG